MIIKQIKINRFGKLKDERIMLSDGLNIICGPNESGKSTIHGFILNMIFGMKRSKGRASKTDDFTRFEPAEEPANYSGSLTMECRGKEYVLTRDFSAGKRRDRLISADDGEVMTAEDSDIEALTGGLTRRVYDNTENLSQSGVLDPAVLDESMKDRYTHIAVQGDDGGSVSGALRALVQERKQLEAVLRKKQKDREERIREKELALEYTLSELNEKTGELKADRSVSEKNTEIKKGSIAGKAVAAVIFLTAAVLCGAGAAFSPESFRPYIMITAAVCAMISVLFFFAAVKKKTGREDRKLEYQEKELEKLRKKAEKFKKEYNAEVSMSVNSEEKKQIEGLKLAEETIERLAVDFRSRYEDGYRRLIEKYFRYITGEYDTRIVFDRTGELMVVRKGVCIAQWQLSRGTEDILELCCRFAAADMLKNEEKMPLLLDDAFVNYDDDRLRRALIMISDRKRQVIMFTCHKRELMLLKELGIAFNKVKWTGDKA